MNFCHPLLHFCRVGSNHPVVCVPSSNSSSFMKHPLPKRRRVSSNPMAPFSSSGAFGASPKPSRLTTCTSCHRTIGLKSSPTFLCARFVVFYPEASFNDSYHTGAKHCRCSASSCAICLRTCTSDSTTTPRSPGSLNLPLDSIVSPLSQCNKNTSPLRGRRPRDDDNDNMLKTKEVDDGRTGCGQVVCRTCCFEDPQRSE